MDADLQHPPELITALLEQAESRDLDLVVASRYCERGERSGLGWTRAMASRSSTTVARLLFPRRLREVSDPMSGFFLVRREAIAPDQLRPRGFKILLEILIRHPALRVAEVWFAFGERRAGKSKATIREGVRYLSLLARLRFARFGAVGASGLVVNTLVLALLTDVAGLFYVISAVVATQASTLWNFCFTEAWVFSDREHRRGRATRMALFFLMNNAALALRGPLLILLTSGLGIHYVVSNIISLVGADARALHARGHLDLGEGAAGGGAASPVRLRHPRDRERAVGRAFAGAGALPRRRPRRRARRPRPPRAPLAGGRGACRPVPGGPGRLGFGVAIGLGDRIEATASPLVGRSPHVLYTNVVEPILRWTFAERGYALVHAACLAHGDNAFLVTARTDTGKTTTSLRMLDRRGLLLPLRRPDARDARRDGRSPTPSRSRSAATR